MTILEIGLDYHIAYQSYWIHWKTQQVDSDVIVRELLTDI